MSSHTHCCCHGAGSHAESPMALHAVHAPSQRHGRHYSPNTARVHKHASIATQVHLNNQAFGHLQAKHSLGKYSRPLSRHISKNVLDPRLIRSNSTRYACQSIGHPYTNQHFQQRTCRSLLTNLDLNLSTRQATLPLTLNLFRRTLFVLDLTRAYRRPVSCHGCNPRRSHLTRNHEHKA